MKILQINTKHPSFCSRLRHKSAPHPKADALVPRVAAAQPRVGAPRRHKSTLHLKADASVLRGGPRIAAAQPDPDPTSVICDTFLVKLPDFLKKVKLLKQTEIQEFCICISL